MSIMSKLFGRSERLKTITTTASSPYRVPNPIVGFVCVAPELEPLMQSDKAALGPIFFEARSSTKEIVRCHVLFFYCQVGPDGGLPGLKMRIRDFIKASGACVAVVASENDGNRYKDALKPKNDWPANIVLVIDRRGSAFVSFFQKLFQAMRDGMSMLTAWVQLAPQIPNHEHPECPVSYMCIEAGHVALNGRA
jgi:hypothetical protein